MMMMKSCLPDGKRNTDSKMADKAGVNVLLLFLRSPGHQTHFRHEKGSLSSMYVVLQMAAGNSMVCLSHDWLFDERLKPTTDDTENADLSSTFRKWQVNIDIRERKKDNCNSLTMCWCGIFWHLQLCRFFWNWEKRVNFLAQTAQQPGCLSHCWNTLFFWGQYPDMQIYELQLFCHSFNNLTTGLKEMYDRWS